MIPNTASFIALNLLVDFNLLKYLSMRTMIGNLNQEKTTHFNNGCFHSKNKADDNILLYNIMTLCEVFETLCFKKRSYLTAI